MNKEQEAKKRHIHELVKKLDKDNHQLDVTLELSTELVSVGDVEQAEELLLRSLTIFPKNPQLIYNLGNVYYTAGKYDKADDIFDQLIKKDFGFEAYFMKAKTLNEQGKTSIAIAFALTASEKNPQDVDSSELLADLLMANGNFDSAIGIYQKAIQIKPKAKYYFNIGICSMNLEKPYQEYLNKARQLDERYYLEHEKKLADLQKYLQENGEKND